MNLTRAAVRRKSRARAECVQFVRDFAAAFRPLIRSDRPISGADCVDYCSTLAERAQQIVTDLGEQTP